jgi:hypothetical protein
LGIENSPDAYGPAAIVLFGWAARFCGLDSKKMNEKLESKK